LAKSVDEIATYTLDAMEQTLGFDFADMALVESACVRVLAYRGHPAVLWEAPLDGRSVKVQAANTKKAVRVPDTRKEAAYVDGKGFDWNGEPTALSELAVPVLVDGETVAVLNVESRLLNAFTSDDQSLLEILAIHVASDIRRLRHLEALRKNEQHLEERVNERTRNLKESEARYKSLISNIPEKIFAKDRNSVFISCNDKLAEDFKIKAEDIVGKTDYDFFPKDLADHYRADDKRIMESGRTEEIEERYPVGRWEFWVNTLKTPIRDASGSITGLIGIFRDITERKLMIQQLRKDEERYRSLFESSPISLWEEDFSEVKRYVTDLRSRGVGDLREHFTSHPQEVAKCFGMVKVVDVNKATLELYNVKSKGDFVDGLAKIFAVASQDVFREELLAWAEGKKSFESEIDNRTLNGEVKQVRLICDVVPGYENTLARVLVSIVDLTQQKQMREELLRSQHLADIGQMATMVGHDLRNPLQGISGAVEILEKELGSASNDTVREMVGILKRGVEYSNEILAELSDYSREIKLDLTKTSLKPLLNKSLELVLKPENVRIEDLSEDVNLEADIKKMQRVFVNIIGNAVDAMPNGGQLMVTSRNSRDSVEVSFADTGIGIPADELAKIWTPLHTTKARGMGLGLVIAKRIVEAHNGTISVESVQGKGSVFRVTIPRAEVN
jgi:PAS domain S-box-containing protein